MADEKRAHVLPYANGADAHEERLLRVEGDVAVLRERGARTEALVEGLPSQIEGVVERLCDKIDSSVEPVARGHAELTQRHNALAEAVAAHQPVIEELVERKKARAERRDLWRKAAWAVGSGAVAVLVKEVVAWVIRVAH